MRHIVHNYHYYHIFVISFSRLFRVHMYIVILMSLQRVSTTAAARPGHSPLGPTWLRSTLPPDLRNVLETSLSRHWPETPWWSGRASLVLPHMVNHIDPNSKDPRIDVYCVINDDYSDVIMSVTVSEITSVSTVCSGADQRKHQSSASLAFARGIHWWIPFAKGR